MDLRDGRARIAGIAQALERRGLRRGDGVAVLSANHPSAFCFQMAALSIGCRYTGLHPLGSLEDQLWILEDAEIRLFAFDPRIFAERAAEIAARAESLDLVSLGPSGSAPDIVAAGDDEHAMEIPSRAEEADIAYLLYTGGTTGRPKGVEDSRYKRLGIRAGRP